MDLVERYLGAVRWNLPADKADDIVAELADLIAARREDREEVLGRPLTRDEVSALLKDFGHPLAVAGQYHGQRALIGPEVFPFYWFALRIWLAVVAIIELIEIGGRVIVGSQPFSQALSQGMAQALHTLLFHAALVTLAFAVVERTGWLGTYLARWKPEELPELRAMKARRPQRSARWEAVFGIAMGIAFLGWWSGSIGLSLTPRDGSVRVLGAPVWAGLYWPVVALVWAQIVQNLVTLLRPAWKGLRALLVVGVAAGTVAIAAFLHQAGRIVVATATSDAAQAASVQEGLDIACRLALVIVPLIAIVQAAVDLWRLARDR